MFIVAWTPPTGKESSERRWKGVCRRFERQMKEKYVGM
jgi:hypothetical protein